jgi:hypothetical protein
LEILLLAAIVVCCRIFPLGGWLLFLKIALAHFRLGGWAPFLRSVLAHLASGGWLLFVGSALALIFGLVFWILKTFLTHGNPAVLLFALVRAANLTSGVSPLMPLLLAGIAAFSVVGCLLGRLTLLEDCPLEPPFLGFEGDAPAVSSFAGINQQEKRMIGLLECSPHCLPGMRVLLLSLLVGFVYFGIAKVWPTQSIDGGWLDLFFLFAGFSIYFFLSIMLLRFVLVWMALRLLLRRLYFHPTRGAYQVLRVTSLSSEDNKIRLFRAPPELCRRGGLPRLRARHPEARQRQDTLEYIGPSGRAAARYFGVENPESRGRAGLRTRGGERDELEIGCNSTGQPARGDGIPLVPDYNVV